jgi:hypothetical protein
MSRFFVPAPTQEEFWTGERCVSGDLHNDDASPEASLAVARLERRATIKLHRLVGACKRGIVGNGQGIRKAVIRRVRQQRSGSKTPATAISNRGGSVGRAVSMWKPPDRHSLNAVRPTGAATSAGQAVGGQRGDDGTAPVGPAVPNQKWSINVATRFVASGAAAGGAAGAFIRPTQKAVKSGLLPPQAKPYRAAMR